MERERATYLARLVETWGTDRGARDAAPSRAGRVQRVHDASPHDVTSASMPPGGCPDPVCGALIGTVCRVDRQNEHCGR